ncbi:MAG TPA: preprotein translocase subunit SecG [Candidatus Nanopelagicaceae bacterium]|nr:preprotein translocase subunit SecG [Candidatus Nanopelagicaceae bacterium]
MVMTLSILLVITSVLMILLVLLHKGKGSGLSDLFGGGISSNYGGSSVVERNLDRITIVAGAVWFATVVALGLILKK